MPKKLHDKLEKEAKKKKLTGARKNAYVFGPLFKIEKEKKKKKPK